MPATTKKPRKTTKKKVTKKKTTTRKKTTKKKTTTRKKTPRTRTVTREVIREVPVYYNTQMVPFLPFRAMNTDAATNNLIGYMRGLLDGKKNAAAHPVNPMLVPTNTRRSQRHPERTRRAEAPTRLHGDRNIAQQILDDHHGRHSRHNDARTSVFRDIERDMGVHPRRIAI